MVAPGAGASAGEGQFAGVGVGDFPRFQETLRVPHDAQNVFARLGGEDSLDGAGFALQLGLLGLVARSGGFEGVVGAPLAHEYWSLTKHKDGFGKRVCPDKTLGAEDFLAHAEGHFIDAARKWLTGEEPFTAKLHPAYAPYGEYDQLMRLEEWYGRL